MAKKHQEIPIPRQITLTEELRVDSIKTKLKLLICLVYITQNLCFDVLILFFYSINFLLNVFRYYSIFRKL